MNGSAKTGWEPGPSALIREALAEACETAVDNSRRIAAQEQSTLKAFTDRLAEGPSGEFGIWWKPDEWYGIGLMESVINSKEQA